VGFVTCSNLAEHLTLDQSVGGSNPAGLPARANDDLSFTIVKTTSFGLLSDNLTGCAQPKRHFLPQLVVAPPPLGGAFLLAYR
jgi:hypothetical protein